LQNSQLKKQIALLATSVCLAVSIPPPSTSLSFSLCLSFFRLIANFVSFTGVSSYVVYSPHHTWLCLKVSPPPPPPAHTPLSLSLSLSVCVSCLYFFVCLILSFLVFYQDRLASCGSPLSKSNFSGQCPRLSELLQAGTPATLFTFSAF
jgi:hypothetical protein